MPSGLNITLQFLCVDTDIKKDQVSYESVGYGVRK